MAVYKVIQDIEAEDKLLGPLTLKGFIYAGITIFLAFVNFKLLTVGGIGPFRWLFLLLFLPPMLLFGILASPIGRDQPTEVWLLSHVRFWLKPRKRVWNQSGIIQLVTITVPKKIDRFIAKNLSPSEVKGRLETLATTLDSRGWAVKNVSVEAGGLLSYLQAESGASDRLVAAGSLIQSQPVVGIHASDDILDADNNSKAQQINELLKQQDSQRKQDLLNEISGQPSTKTARPSAKSKTPSAGVARQVTPPAQTAKLKELAQSGNALSVASVAKLANSNPIQQVGPNEVVISLH